jgi:hypothetical protein
VCVSVCVSVCERERCVAMRKRKHVYECVSVYAGRVREEVEREKE